MLVYQSSTLINCLKLSIEKGLARGAIEFAGLCDKQIERFTDEQRSEYESLVPKVMRMREIEDIHGKGCLLHLDDPLIVKMQKIGAISGREVSSAKKYRSQKPSPDYPQAPSQIHSSY